MVSEVIFGREGELAEIAGDLADDQRGPRAVLIEGQAGMGKTMLWRAAVRLMQARGRVLVSRASEAETRLSFALLGDLLEPVVSEVLEGLPLAQRRALQTALLLTASPTSRPDPRAVALGVLGALRSLAGHGTLTIALDDVKWVDVPSARTLGFALRRLHDEPVVVVATKRSPGGCGPLDLTGAFSSDVSRMALRPIDARALGQMLQDRLKTRFPLPLVKRIHETSGGNPLYGLEMARELIRQGTLPGPGQPLPVPPDLASLLRGRLARLSAQARRLLLLIASAGTPTVGLVEVVESLASLEEVERAGIVVVSGTAIE
ncbi:MAG: AAA family ATPase, partial [Mycobacteriales bacterium]